MFLASVIRIMCAERHKLNVNAFIEKVYPEQMLTVSVNLRLTRLQWNECTFYSLNTWKLLLHTHPPWFLILAAGMMSQIVFLVWSSSAIIRLSLSKPLLSSQTCTNQEKICVIKQWINYGGFGIVRENLKTSWTTIARTVALRNCSWPQMLTFSMPGKLECTGLQAWSQQIKDLF